MPFVIIYLFAYSTYITYIRKKPSYLVDICSIQQLPLLRSYAMTAASVLLINSCHKKKELPCCESRFFGRGVKDSWDILPPTWRIIPFSKCLISMVSKYSVGPLSGVIPLPNGPFLAYKCRLLTTYEVERPSE